MTGEARARITTYVNKNIADKHLHEMELHHLIATKRGAWEWLQYILTVLCDAQHDTTDARASSILQNIRARSDGSTAGFVVHKVIWAADHCCSAGMWPWRFAVAAMINAFERVTKLDLCHHIKSRLITNPSPFSQKGGQIMVSFLDEKVDQGDRDSKGRILWERRWEAIKEHAQNHVRNFAKEVFQETPNENWQPTYLPPYERSEIIDLLREQTTKPSGSQPRKQRPQSPARSRSRSYGRSQPRSPASGHSSGGDRGKNRYNRGKWQRAQFSQITDREQQPKPTITRMAERYVMKGMRCLACGCEDWKDHVSYKNCNIFPTLHKEISIDEVKAEAARIKDVKTPHAANAMQDKSAERPLDPRPIEFGQPPVEKDMGNKYQYKDSRRDERVRSRGRSHDRDRSRSQSRSSDRNRGRDRDRSRGRSTERRPDRAGRDRSRIRERDLDLVRDRERQRSRSRDSRPPRTDRNNAVTAKNNEVPTNI
jgi:hypothetical protein